MAEGWTDCPALGPGWKRREAFRKSGATCGRTDTYYQSPTGQKFRSKIELSRFLGPGRDLGSFDFKRGLERPGAPKPRKGPKWRPPFVAAPPGAGPGEGAEPGAGAAPAEGLEPRAGAEPVGGGAAAPPPCSPSPAAAAAPLLLAPPPPSPGPAPGSPAPPPAMAPPPADVPAPLRRTRKRPLPPEPPQDGVVACCASCQSLFPGVTLPPQRRCRWLCPECRAQRRIFNREQRIYKRVGCGSCAACRLPQDCGLCGACARRGRPPTPARPPKCLRRRCLRILAQPGGCGRCPGCRLPQDCGSCRCCRRRLEPGRERLPPCLRRRCQRSLTTKKSGRSPRKLTVKWKPPERDPSVSSPGPARHRKQLKGKEKKKPGRPPKHPGGPRAQGRRGPPGRRSRRCGSCAACARPGDCGRCDFCRDKPKFGGRNRKRQKCRWRQCLRFATDKEESPPPLPVKEEPAPPPPQVPRRGPPGLLPAPRLKLEVLDPHADPPPPPPLLPVAPAGGLLVAPLKREPPLPPRTPGPLARRFRPPLRLLAPLPPPRPRRGRLLPLDEEEEEEEEEGDAVHLMELYSLGALTLRHPASPLATVAMTTPATTTATLAPPPGAALAPPPGAALAPPPAPSWPDAFLAELAEIPLPAHWAVVSGGSCHGDDDVTGCHGDAGGDVRLMQRSPRSPMAATVVLLGPGLAFRVVAAPRRPVPPQHEVFARRPPRLRGVDDVVELLCDLEAYRLCPGPPPVTSSPPDVTSSPSSSPSPACHVLVAQGCCRPCRLRAGHAA